MNLNVFGLFLIEICNDDMQYPGLQKSTVMWMEISSCKNCKKIEL